MLKNTIESLYPSTPSAPLKMLSILLVEDELMSREMLHLKLDGHFKHVFVANDGHEGFELYCRYQPDIVLTDQVMPHCSGIDLLCRIRAKGDKTPVILMTSSINEDTLLEAINCGVDRFVPKPFDFDLVMRTLNGIAKEVVNERVLDQHRRQEIEHLRYRDSYNSMQQEAARRKEQHVVRHDLRDQILHGSGSARWGISVAHTPRDIMCGDAYSIRNLFDGRQLIFIIDAMGAGLSASLTAMLTTSFCNYQIDNLHKWDGFTLSSFLRRFQEYLVGMLLEEEVLSCGFFLVDLVKEQIECAIFALPPLLVRGLDGSITRVRGGNPPLGVYGRDVNTSILSLGGVTDLLFVSDGVTDAELLDGGSYREVIEADFRMCPTLKALQREFQEKTDQEALDDLTMLHLRRLDPNPEWSWTDKPVLSLLGIGLSIRKFLDALLQVVNLTDVEQDELELILTEALTNSLEHGCLGIDREEKSRLQNLGTYEEILEKGVIPPAAGIWFAAFLVRGSGKQLLQLEIVDNGPGLPDNFLHREADTNAMNGRGMKMIKRFSDLVSVGGPGGHVIISKTLEGEYGHAD